MGDSLKKKMVSAVAWSTLEKFGQQVLQLLAGMVFARILFPEDFGIMGISMIVVTLSMILVESGFGQALIRKPDVNQDDYTSVFFVNLALAVLLCALLYVSSPFIAAFFHQPQLIPLIRVLSCIILINAFYLIPYAQLGRAMKFKTISGINLISIFTGSVAGIGAALFHMGVWSLVVQQTTFHVLRGLILWIVVRWKPVGRFRFNTIRHLGSFSLQILITSLINVLFNNLFLILLGRTSSKAEAGQFSQGNKLADTFSFTFQSIFAGSTFSLFSQLQNDTERLGRILGEMIRRTSIVTIPIVATLIAMAPSLITLLWTEKFLPAVVYFQWMSLAALFAPFYLMNINALNARGKSRKTMLIEIIKKVMIVTGMVLLYQEGVQLMIVSFTVGSLLAYPVSVWFVARELKMPFLQPFTNIVPGVLTALAIAVPTALIQYFAWSEIATLAMQVLVSVLLYLLIVYFFFRTLFHQFLDFLRRNISFIKPRVT